MILYAELSDTDLVVLLKQADHAAFTEIYKRYALLFFHKVNKMLKDEDSSKDIIQELFIRLWNNPEKLQENGNLSGYLYVSVRNLVLQLIRKGKVMNDYLNSIAGFVEEVNMDTLNELDERELTRILQEEIEKLPAKMKQVFEMSRNQYLSHAEIAAQLGISDQTVKKQVNNALKILRSKVSAYAPAGWMIIELLKK
ncbi:RNA polymerase sigma-70 factor (family 1) [Pedobacter africanus]|uniref:RNA polymerase sigma-70 factor (ECF subfamily) n=1 Tax=Pedobacter africanus TaxID=151894 RepID=A0ACC6L3N0_9SPHI|nr:RNA polymerase sigma-70 factor [Pedobacter africanus]MDR6786117.1 RNA polymerase sigma-70 factor (ECF subfamily) [Pedobacter africanus]